MLLSVWCVCVACLPSETGFCPPPRPARTTVAGWQKLMPTRLNVAEKMRWWPDVGLGSLAPFFPKSDGGIAKENLNKKFV